MPRDLESLMDGASPRTEKPGFFTDISVEIEKLFEKPGFWE